METTILNPEEQPTSQHDQQAKSPSNGHATPSAASDLMEELRQEVTGGMLYTHHRANANTNKTLEAASFAYALIELLIEKGVLTEEELDERKRQVAERLAAKFRGDGMGVLRMEPEHDKYKFEGGVKIDCENRLQLCHAACCRLQFALSRQDVEEGVVKWDFARPYLNQQGKDGYCIHRDGATCRCSIYEKRPVPCRAYDCRNDKRIWLDFENRVVNPDLDKVFAKDSNGKGGNGLTSESPEKNAPDA